MRKRCNMNAGEFICRFSICWLCIRKLSAYNLKLVAVLCLLFQVTGCGTLPSGRGWGEDVSLTNWRRIKQAAVNAAKDPETWAPLAGAAVFSMGSLDEDVSHWLSEDTPLFGSTEAASDASTYLKEALSVAKYATALATPSGNSSAKWVPSKLKGLAVILVASKTTSVTTDVIKDTVDRQRPDGSDDRSFPSGHVSDAYASSTLASRNVDSLNLSENSKRVMQFTFKGLAAGTAWARMEANRHYPSDVLFAAAMSHFLSAFIYDAFMGLDGNVATVAFTNDLEGMSLQLGWQF